MDQIVSQTTKFVTTLKIVLMGQMNMSICVAGVSRIELSPLIAASCHLITYPCLLDHHVCVHYFSHLLHRCGVQPLFFILCDTLNKMDLTVYAELSLYNNLPLFAL